MEKDNFFVIMNPDPEIEQTNIFQKLFGFQKLLRPDSVMSTTAEKAVEYEIWKIKQIYGVKNITADKIESL